MDLGSKAILVTGADGFIGSHLVESLVHKGLRVKALSQYNSFNNWGWLEDINCLRDVEVLCGDVQDAHYMSKITKGVDVIFHLAALIAIPYSYIAPDSYIDTNIKGTLNVCQAALENGAQKVLITSTSEVYGSAQYVPIDEKHPLQPQSPYSATKIGADAIAESFYRSFGLPVCIVRPFNTYGPRQSARAIISTIITQIASGKKQVDLGDVTPTRDFSYVKDTIRGFIELAKCDQSIGETVNIGSNREISIADVFELIKKTMNSGAECVMDDQRIRPEKSEVRRLCCDNSKIKEMIGFEPEYTLEQGLRETIDWFTASENLKKYKTHIYNV
ncbi:MAG: NAD-dependent 4,6-dehydratase LegB [Holosporales bacterium]|jgi:NAD dependent epimerase/dehydratase|nr:NAD-dependent 4,6-dehydratase LegB [Holosporales bacterium]